MITIFDRCKHALAPSRTIYLSLTHSVSLHSHSLSLTLFPFTLTHSHSSPSRHQQGVLQHRWMVRHCGAPAALPTIAVSSGSAAAQPSASEAAAPSSHPASAQRQSALAQPTSAQTTPPTSATAPAAVVASEGTAQKEKDKGAGISLASAQVQMKKFNARRKFRVSRFRQNDWLWLVDIGTFAGKWSTYVHNCRKNAAPNASDCIPAQRP